MRLRNVLFKSVGLMLAQLPCRDLFFFFFFNFLLIAFLQEGEEAQEEQQEQQGTTTELLLVGANGYFSKCKYQAASDVCVANAFAFFLFFHFFNI